MRRTDRALLSSRPCPGRHPSSSAAGTEGKEIRIRLHEQISGEGKENFREGESTTFHFSGKIVNKSMFSGSWPDVFIYFSPAVSIPWITSAPRTNATLPEMYGVSHLPSTSEILNGWSPTSNNLRRDVSGFP